MLSRIKQIDWLGIIVESNALSIGRVMLWITFAIMIHFWLASVEVPATLMTAFMVFVSYNLGKKAQHVVEGWVANGKNSNQREIEI